MTEQQSSGLEAEATVEFGNYLVHELIGAGGMAEVYRASVREPTDRVPAGDVVIKRVKPRHAQDPGFVNMFVDEAKLSAQLQHPNIVSVYEHGEHDGHHFIAMEYIDGLHLQGLHVRYSQQHKKALPWAVGVIVVRDLLRGLHYAHEKVDEAGRPMRLIHRDINLVNIMVSRAGAVKVLDFGIVKAADGIRSAETVGGVLKGKFGYMSPEQAEGKPLDRRSDVFAASVVLHELLTGRRLFWGKDDLEILRKVRTGDIPDPREFTPEVPADLVEGVRRGLARPLEERFQSAGEMADALDELLRIHHVADATLIDLMAELLGPDRSEASDKMARRRRKMTLLAWQQGVAAQEASRPVRASGVISKENAQPTEPGRGQDRVESAVEQDTLITTDVRALSSDGEPVLSEQDMAALEGLSAQELADLQTKIVAEDEVGGPAELSDAETRILAEGEAPDAELSDAETRILAEGEAPDVSLGALATEIVAAERAQEGTAERAQEGAEDDRWIDAPHPVPEDAADADTGRGRRIRILLAITAVLAVIVIVALVVKNG